MAAELGQSSQTRVAAQDLIRLRLAARHLTLTGKRPVSSVIAGVHASRFRGRGVDFVESRNYEIGDDIRDLDWRVTARTGRPHTKVFQEERERPVLVLLDLNPSMYFGTRGCLKVVQGARLAALIGWAATRRGDRIGGLLFHGDAHHEIRPAGGRRGALRLISLISRWGEACATAEFARPDADLGAALKRLRRIARPGSLVFLLSDFYAPGPECERHLAALRQHNDVVACRVCDPLELQLPPPGAYPVSDGISHGVLDLRRNSVRAAYRRFVDEHADWLRQLCRKHALSPLTAQTTDDPTEVLGRLFRLREAA